MCTVTFVPRGSGYYLGMNRDENLARVPGLAPRRIIENGCGVTCPSEPEGGTWISTNDKCVSLALINWYSIPGQVSGPARSRGQRVRNQIFQKAQRQKSVGTLGWLRRLHRCHAPESGPFSTCMHRSDAATVSYTEIAVSGRRVRMQYHAGAPCGLVGANGLPSKETANQR